MIDVVVKIGGSLFTDKNRLEPMWFFEDDFGDDFYSKNIELALSFLENNNYNCKSLVFGAGSFGHPAAQELGLNDKDYLEVNALYANELSENLQELKNEYLYPVINSKYQELIKIPYLDIKRTSLQQFVKVRIISGDEVLVEQAKLYDVKKIIIFSDSLPIVCGKEVRFLSEIKSLSELDRIDTNKIDVTGGMKGKLAKLLTLNIETEFVKLEDKA